MYRDNASPAAETLHTMVVRPSKGGTVVALLFSGALLCAVTFVVLVFTSGPHDDVRAAEIGSAIGTLALAGAAFTLHARRGRMLRIERVGVAHRLVIDATPVELAFPVACHGTQFASPIGRLKVHEVYLQLVDPKGRAIMLHETRGAAYGAQEGWFADDVDRTVTSTVFDLSGLGDAAKVRDWIRAIP